MQTEISFVFSLFYNIPVKSGGFTAKSESTFSLNVLMCVNTCMNSADSHCKDTFCADLTATVEHVRAALCTCICLLGRRRRRGMGHGTGQQGEG